MFRPYDPSEPRSSLIASVTADDGGAGAGGADKAAADKAAADKAAADKATADKAASDKAAASGRGDKVVPMTRTALAQHAKLAADKGGQRALLALAQSAGFKSVDELQAAIKGLGTSTGKGAADKGKGQNADKGKQQGKQGQGGGQDKRQGQGGGGQDKAAKEREEMQRKLQDATRRGNRTERQLREMRSQLDAKDAEIELRGAAHGVGVVDTDYALHLLRQHLQGKDQAYLDGFDAGAWFKGLRTGKPFLFGQAQAEPADTNPGGSGSDKAPDAAEAARRAGQGGKFDARTATQEQIDAYLRSLKIPTTGPRN